MTEETSPSQSPTSRQWTVLTPRHSVVVRLTHWLNVVCLTFLLLSGLQIFNAYPRLHWGQYGANADPAFLEIGGGDSNGQTYGYVTIDGRSFVTTGVLGLSKVDGVSTPRAGSVNFAPVAGNGCT